MGHDVGMPKDATPDRYVVDKTGTPDPARAEYYVLDVVHDFEARVALRGLVRNYRRLQMHVRADELERLLEQTQDAHQAVCEARNPKAKRATRKQAQRVAHA